MQPGGKTTYKKTRRMNSKKGNSDFFCSLVKYLYKDLYMHLSRKTGLVALILFFFFATSLTHAALIIPPGAPISIQTYGNQLAGKISSDFDIHITATGAPDVFNVSVSKASGANQTLKSVTYEARIIAGIVTVTSSTVRADFFAGTPVTYTGAKLFDGMKIIFPSSDPIVEITRMILRSKNNPAVDEVNFQSKGRYWKIHTGKTTVYASEDTVDDMHVHTGSTVSDQIKHGEHEKMIELVKYVDATHRIVKSGNWSDASIWENEVLPGAGARVFVGEGLTITVDQEFLSGVFYTVRIDGTIRFKTTVNTGLKVRTLVTNAMASFYMGTADDRVRPGVTSQILIADRGVRDAAARLIDPLDLDGGVIAHGQIFNMFGEEKTAHAIPNETLQAGLTRLTFVEAPKGWHAGDELVFPTTTDPDDFQIPDEDELIKITAISGDGKMITLERALQYNHLAPPGVKDPKNPAKLLAIPVGNLTRNAFFKSEATYLPPVYPPSPMTSALINEVQAGLSRRGHFMVMHAQSGVLIDGAGFYDLGRTNARIGTMLTIHTIPMLDTNGQVIPGTDTNTIGRYSLHIHGRTGADALKNPIRISNCAITRSPKHGLVNHGGHVMANDNVTFDVAGSHFFAENGSEIGTFTHNLAVRSFGPVPSGGDNFFLLGSFNQTTNNGTVPAFDAGGNGFGFWMQGQGIRVLDNYSFHHRHSAFAYYALGLKEGLRDSSLAEWLRVPTIQFQVANMNVADADGNVDPEKVALKDLMIEKGLQEVPIQAVPTTFARNVGGASMIGLFAPYIQTSMTWNSYYSKIQDSVLWGIINGVNVKYSARVHFQNIIVIREPAGVNAKDPNYRVYGGGFGGNEATRDIIYDQVHVEGFAGGIGIPFYGNNVVKDSFLKNIINIGIPAPKAEGNIEGQGFDPGDDRRITIQNVRFEALNRRGYYNEPSLDIYFGGRYIHDNPAEGPDPTMWLPDRNLVEIIGQDVNSIRIGSDYVPSLFYDRFYITLVSPKFTNQLMGYVAAAKRTAYPHLPPLYSAPVNLNEGWNHIPITVPPWTSDCVNKPVGCQPQVRSVMVFGDTTPPTFVPDPQIPLTIDSDHLSQGFYLMGNVIDQTGNFKTVQNFSRNFTNLTVDPDGKVRLRFSVSDQAGNTAQVVIPLTYIVNTYTIRAQAGAGGTITPSGAVSVTRGADQSFTVTANNGHKIDRVFKDGKLLFGFWGCPGSGSDSESSSPPVTSYTYNFTNVIANHTIAATFSSVNYSLNVTMAGTGTGKVTKYPDQPSYAAGAVVQLTAIPAADSVFTGWTVGGSTDTASSLSITMNADQNITANFSIKTYRIYAGAGLGGTITPSGYLDVPHGSSQAFTIVPNPGYAVKDVRVDGVSKGNISNFDFTNVTAVHSILAIFQPVYTLDVIMAGTGTGTVTKSPDQANYVSGAVVQLTAAPAAGSAFTGWTIGDATDNTNPLSITMNANQTVTANFRLTTLVNPSDTQIIADMVKVINDHLGVVAENPEIANFDLNSDGLVTSTDMALMQNIWRVDSALWASIMDKFTAEILSRLGLSTNPRYLPEFDVNKNGSITITDLARIRIALSRTDLWVVGEMEKVIWGHLWNGGTDVSNSFPGFDLSGDGIVSASDVILMRNIWTLPYEKFVIVFDQFMQEVTKTVGARKGEARYIPEFDVDKNDIITAAHDRGRILTALNHGRTDISSGGGFTIQLVQKN